MLILVLKENEQDQAHLFQGIFFENYSIHQVAIICPFKYTNHGNHLFFFYFKTLFCVRVSCISNIFHAQETVKAFPW